MSGANRRDRDRKKRAKLRANLRAEGVGERLIDKIIEQQRHEDLVARHGLDEARTIAYVELHRRGLDDTGYKPSAGDPLLRGPGRVDGVTAKVVQRSSTITRFQYDRIAPETDTP